MTKTQKIWLSVFLAMAIIPEILWSPVGNFWYSLKAPTIHGSYQVWRNNFLQNYGNAGIWSNFILFQFFGLIFSIILLVLSRKRISNKLFLWASVIILTIFALFVLNMYRLSSMHITLF